MMTIQFFAIDTKTGNANTVSVGYGLSEFEYDEDDPEPINSDEIWADVEIKPDAKRRMKYAESKGMNINSLMREFLPDFYNKLSNRLKSGYYKNYFNLIKSGLHELF